MLLINQTLAITDNFLESKINNKKVHHLFFFVYEMFNISEWQEMRFQILVLFSHSAATVQNILFFIYEPL